MPSSPPNAGPLRRPLKRPAMAAIQAVLLIALAAIMMIGVGKYFSSKDGIAGGVAARVTDLFAVNGSGGPGSWGGGSGGPGIEVTTGSDRGASEETLDDYVKKGVFKKGSVKHLPAADADEAIRKALSGHLDGAKKDGRKIEGKVAVVGDKEWDEAGKAHYGDRWKDRRDKINGFVDSQGRVWVHKDRGNGATMIHEGVHKYSDRAMIKVSQPLNEGVTEYFTRKTAATLNPPVTGRRNYESNYRFVDRLVKVVGEDAVAKAYFDGDMAGLKKAYLKAGKTQSDWDKMIQLTKQNRWQDASQLAKR